MTFLTHEEWSEMTKSAAKLNSASWRATKMELFLSKTIPYCRFLPVTDKRKRVRIRNWFRYAYLRRAMRSMTNALSRFSAKPVVNAPEPIEFDFEWEIKH